MRLFIILFVFSSTVSFGQWKSFYPEKENVKSKQFKNDKNEKKTLLYNNLFFNAIKQKSLENFDHAIKLFEKCIEEKPEFFEAYYQLSLINKKYNRILEAKDQASQAVSGQPKNIWYLRNYADLLFLNQEFSESAKSYNKIIEIEPNNEFNYYKLADTYIYSEEYSKAIKVYDRLEQKKGVDKMISMQKHKLYLQLRNFSKATKTLENLSQNFPDDIEVLQILAEAYILANKQAEAMKIYEKISENDPNNGQLNLTLANFYRDNGDFNKSFSELKKAFQSDKVNIETKLTILASYLSIINTNDTIKKQAFQLAKILESNYSQNAEVYAIYGDLFYSLNEKEESKKYYKKSLNIKQDIKPVWTQILFLDVESANYDSLILYSEKAILYYPSEPLYYYFFGVSNSYFKNYEEARVALETGIEYVFDNDALNTEFQISLADNYNSLELFSKSDSLYKLILKNNPENILVLNNYSYYLSLRKENLIEAKEMSKKCNDLEPNNGTYQDTYAWVLYCLGEYEKAKLWLEKALKNGGESSAVIIEHYGDVLFKMGQKNEAVIQWKKSKSVGEGSKFLDKKIINEELYE